MNLPKAIEIKEIFYKGGDFPNWADYRKADLLSIEALQHCQRLRSDKHCSPTKPLPSETDGE